MESFTGATLALLLFVMGAICGSWIHGAWLKLRGMVVVDRQEHEHLLGLLEDLPPGVTLEEEMFTDADETATVHKGRLAQARAVIVELAADRLVAAFPLTRSGRDIIPGRARAWQWFDTEGWARVAGRPVDVIEAAIRKGFFADLRTKLREEDAPLRLAELPQ